MAKKQTKIDLGIVNFDNINDSELRMLCEQQLNGKRLSPWLQKDQMLRFLRNKEPLPESPVDAVRMYQMCTIIDRIKFYGPMLPCEGNCFEHNDLQVVDCQISNPALRHPKLYPVTDIENFNSK